MRYLKTFVALAEAGNVTRTAERLDYAPSSVTGHVHALETELGLTLLERNGRGIAFTASLLDAVRVESSALNAAHAA